MEPILAEQAIDRKLEMLTSTIVGNYEYYYGAGVLTTFTDLKVEGTMRPEALMEQIKTLEGVAGETEQQTFLLRIMLRYEVDAEVYDEVIMPQLFETGRKKGIVCTD